MEKKGNKQDFKSDNLEKNPMFIKPHIISY